MTVTAVGKLGEALETVEVARHLHPGMPRRDRVLCGGYFPQPRRSTWQRSN
ncbi:hypothetical protein LWP59_18680 [Amycolatopsis acidiphila]|uniref:hypothetical protein n=1 Tax=Amycolatopsis acidiphila TaxID=715473 RepID=UPI001643CDC5|nr:hypothetical protein [Amycolatopsis acidiphila]UIJ63506.1 hypothetical protein LWP59_18680 [Amycolatopsis acidiphila]